MVRSKLILLWIAAVVCFALGGCAPQAAFTPTPTRTPAPTEPAATPTTAPTNTVAPTEVVQAQVVGPTDYPAGVNPLTGLTVTDPTVLQRAPLAIKVSNNVAARPQSGLSYADLVFEHYAEGRETRYTGIFYSQTPERVGSVRSGRLLDLELIPMFDAVLVASGFAEGTLKRLQTKPWSTRNLSGPYVGAPALVRLDVPNVATEHTLFAMPSEVWNRATADNLNSTPTLTPGLAFSTTVPAGGTPATHMTFEFGLSTTKVDWQYDAATGKYVRTLADKPDVDALNNQPLAFANVLAIGAMHVFADYVEDGFSGEHSTEIQVWGEGPATLFRDGQRIEGKWTRLDPQQMLQFTDLNGNVLYLKPGSTWFEVLPIGFDKMTVTP